MLRSGSARSLLRRVAGASAIAIVSASPIACDVLTGGCGDDLFNQPPALYTEGTTENGVYISSDWDPELLLDFPPGQSIKLFHGLGEVPVSWAAYIATEREGDGSAIVLSTGDVELVEITAESLTVRNASCADLYLLVTAQGR